MIYGAISCIGSENINIFSAWWAEQNTSWYFCSTLAQCAAGFEALLGAFLIFQVQSNTIHISELFRGAFSYSRSRRWFDNFAHPTDAEIMKALISYKETDLEAAQWVEKIESAQKFPRALASASFAPMEWWAFVFIVSVIGLLLPAWVGVWKALGLFLILLILFLTAIALWKTKRFVQEAFRKPNYV